MNKKTIFTIILACFVALNFVYGGGAQAKSLAKQTSDISLQTSDLSRQNNDLSRHLSGLSRDVLDALFDPQKSADVQKTMADIRKTMAGITKEAAVIQKKAAENEKKVSSLSPKNRQIYDEELAGLGGQVPQGLSGSAPPPSSGPSGILGGILNFFGIGGGSKEETETVSSGGDTEPAATKVETATASSGGGGEGGLVISGQGDFFPTKAGVVLTYAHNDASGSVTSYSVTTIKDVKGSGRNMTITFGIEILDKNRRPMQTTLGEIVYEVVIRDGVVIMDMNQMIPAGIQLPEGIKYEISGTPLEIPSNLKAGDSLKPSEITMTVDMGIMKSETVIKATGKCLAIENVRIPAGTFKCHKITQTTASTSNVLNNTITNVSTMISWYAPNIGTVKSEHYDDKNNLTSSQVLVEAKGI